MLVTKLQLPAKNRPLLRGYNVSNSCAAGKSNASLRWLRQGSHFGELGWKRSERPETRGTWGRVKIQGEPKCLEFDLHLLFLLGAYGRSA